MNEERQLEKQLDELCTVFFGTASDTEQKMKNKQGIKGQLQEFKTAESNYLKGLLRDLNVYLATNEWKVTSLNGCENMCYSSTKGDLSIQYYALHDGCFLIRYFVGFTGENIQTKFELDTRHDFDDNLLKYFAPVIHGKKAYMTRGNTKESLKDIEKLREIVYVAEQTVNNNTALNGKYNFKAVADTKSVNGNKHNEDIEFEFTTAAELVSNIEDMYQEYRRTHIGS